MNRGRLSRPLPSGFTLIEMIVMITATSLLIGLTALLIQRLLDLDRVDRRRLEATRMVEDLRSIFRRDLHAAEKPPDIGPKRVAATLVDGGSVVYEAEATRIVRRARRPNGSEHRDVFILPPKVEARFEFRGERRPTGLVAIVFEQPEDATKLGVGVFRDYAIESGWGRDRRRREAP